MYLQFLLFFLTIHSFLSYIWKNRINLKCCLEWSNQDFSSFSGWEREGGTFAFAYPSFSLATPLDPLINFGIKYVKSAAKKEVTHILATFQQV